MLSHVIYCHLISEYFNIGMTQCHLSNPSVVLLPTTHRTTRLYSGIVWCLRHGCHHQVGESRQREVIEAIPSRSCLQYISIHYIWVFPKIVVPQHGWFIMENPIKMDDLGGSLIFGNTHLMPTLQWCFIILLISCLL